MENKPLRIILTTILVLFLVIICFGGGVFTGYVLPRSTGFNLSDVLNPNGASTSGQDGTATPVDTETLFQPFWQAWDLVHEQYVDQPVDDEKLMQGAIRGMLDSLGDQHTGYLDPDEYQQANAPLQGDYDGIGAWVDSTGEYLTITSPMDGSPAEAAGLQAGDQIVSVDGQDVSGVDPAIVLRSVLGPAGSSVTLSIQREGESAPFDVTIVRANIKIELVHGKMLDNNIGYIQILQFGMDTDKDLRTTLQKILDQDPDGLVLDLRNNPGGYLETAINIVSQFIGDGTVMYEEYGNGQKITYTARPNGLATDIPLVVLVNEGSASASEITAGAIQDRGRAPLIGATTYGKGSVQSWTELDNSEGAVKITIAHWLTPNGTQITGKGLTPDYVVPYTEEDYNAGKDPQLDKATEVLLELIKNSK
ncbi:MAG TPA: S41 family peptidase [Bellilinea sp.]|nr:S41 family peptidase [Bellilinea sp.]